MNKKLVVLYSSFLMILMLVRPAYAKSEKIGQPIDTTSYQTIIEDVIGKSSNLADKPRGLLYDIDNNGVKELILLYTTDIKTPYADQPFPWCVTSIYTMDGNVTVPLLEEGKLYSQAGGPKGFAGVISQGGKKYFGYYYESGETSYGDNNLIHRDGGWMLYSINGTALTAEQDIRVEIQESVTSQTGTANFNGKKTSWSEYEGWLHDLQRIATLEEYTELEDGMFLENLLIKVKDEYSGSPSSWATDEVFSARTLNLIPKQIDGDYQRNITRENFCEMALQFLTVKTGFDSENLLQKYHLSAISTFSDTKNPAVIAMNALGIVKGVDNSHFNPEAKISREEAAVILWRICELFKDVSPNNFSVSFSDQTKISAWAQKSVEMITACSYGEKRIMNGTGQNLFSPKASYSREQAILTILRLYNFIGDATLIDSLSGKGYTSLSVADIVGEWTIDTQRTMDANGQSLQHIFGSNIRYGYGMSFKNDASFSYYIAAGIGGEGTFAISNDSVNAKYVDYEEKHNQSITLQTIRDESGKLIIVMPYIDFNIFWIHS
ncbi:MAG: S-layer homology domain-containing protein [Oscillospiraceae bacterium]|nr:S-layer homology domain-containing protein [Oscillospiraceae bacterium]